MNRLSLVLLLCAPLYSTTASAEVIEALDTQDYAVSPQPGQTIAAAIDNASPIIQGQRVLRSNTTWYVRWNFKQNSEQPGACKLADPKVVLSGFIQLPKLADSSNAQRNEFERYVKSLKAHEMGRYDIGKKAAAAINTYLSSLPARANCTQLENEANSGAIALLEKHRKLDQQQKTESVAQR